MKVVAIHGVGARFEGNETLAALWLPALNSGLHEAGFPPVDALDFAQIFFGSVFRHSEIRGHDFSLAPYDEDWIRRLLLEFNREVVSLARENQSGRDARGEEPGIEALDGKDYGGVATRGRAPQVLHSILRTISKSRFFKAFGPEHVLLADLLEVRSYLHEASIKAAVLSRVEMSVRLGTRVVVAHSLGSVVAYEALCKHPEWQVDTLVTLGSPLGIRNLVFDELTPPPCNGRGIWPNVARWVNIADKGDIVALEKTLSRSFGPVEDLLIYNGWASHDVCRYLTARETGEAIGKAISK